MNILCRIALCLLLVLLVASALIVWHGIRNAPDEGELWDGRG